MSDMKAFCMVCVCVFAMCGIRDKSRVLTTGREGIL